MEYSGLPSQAAHHILLEGREQLTVSGVEEVESFDENTIVLDTDMGLLTIKGKDLHVSRLTLEKGEIDIEGQADSLVYSSSESFKKTGQSLLSRLFK